MIIIKGDRGKAAIVHAYADKMRDCMIIQYCKKNNFPLQCSDLIVPPEIDVNTIIEFLIKNISKERYTTIVFYTDRTEQEIRELKQKLEINCSNMFNFIITCTLD